MTSKMALTPNL